MKILAEQAELPELIGNIFTDVCNRSIRTHDNFRLILFFDIRVCLIRIDGFVFQPRSGRNGFLFPRHNPTACHFPAARQVNGAGLLQLRKRQIPKMQM